MRHAHVEGGSLSGLTAARLLLDRGWSVDLRTRKPGTAGPVLILEDTTRALLRDLWGAEGGDRVPMHRLSERCVRLAGADGRVAAASWVVRAGELKADLLARLRSQARGRLTIRSVGARRDGLRSTGSRSAWRLVATGRVSASRGGSALRGGAAPPRRSAAGAVACGCRVVIASEGRLGAAASPDRWFFEAVPAGWLLIAPLENRRALVQLMIPDVPADPPRRRLAEAVAAASLARAAVAGLSSAVAVCEAFPARCDPWPHERTLRIGEAALAFDPICGDGLGQALRSAILAAAAIEAIEGGEDRSGVRAFVRHRFGLAFLAHLDTCAGFYASLTPAASWTTELRAMREEAAMLGQELPAPGRLRYRLIGSRLVPRA